MSIPERDHQDQEQSDQWVKGALDAELAQMDATFDFEVGLADVYGRAARWLSRARDEQP